LASYKASVDHVLGSEVDYFLCRKAEGSTGEESCQSPLLFLVPNHAAIRNSGCGPSDKPRLKQLVGLAAHTVIKITRPV